MQGRTLTEICREPGMPAADTLRQWVAEPRRLRRALSEPPRHRSSPERMTRYTAELADRIRGELKHGRIAAFRRVPRPNNAGERLTNLRWMSTRIAQEPDRPPKAAQFRAGAAIVSISII